MKKKTVSQPKKKCAECRKVFEYRNSLQKYCSYDCAKKAQTRVRKKKASEKNALIKALDTLVRKITRRRDKNTCQKCGKKVSGKSKKKD